MDESRHEHFYVAKFGDDPLRITIINSYNRAHYLAYSQPTTQFLVRKEMVFNIRLIDFYILAAKDYNSIKMDYDELMERSHTHGVTLTEMKDQALKHLRSHKIKL